MSRRQDRRKHERRRQDQRREAVATRAGRVRAGRLSPERPVPAEIRRPPYALEPGALSSALPPRDFADRMRTAGRAAREVLDVVGAAVAPGVTTDELDRIAHEAYLERGGYPSTLRYRGYPKSICTSINEVICHGIPDDRQLVEGDIVNVDVTIYLDGVHGDCSATFAVGAVDDESGELVRVTHESLWLGIRAAAAGYPLNAIGRAIQDHAEARGFGVVRTFVGHGIGTEFHTAPTVPHYFDPRSDAPIATGSTFTIEPMINAGDWAVGDIWRDGWTAPTRDGSRSAQFEHTLLIGAPPTPAGTTNDLVGANGVEVLTAWPHEVAHWLGSSPPTLG